MSVRKKFGTLFGRRSAAQGRSLFEAAVIGDLAKVKRLVDGGAYVNHCNVDGFTPLHASAQMGHEEVVKLLLENGGEPNTKNKNGQTCIGSAAHRGHHDVVDLLIQNGAEVNTRCESRSWNPLGYAVRHGHGKVVEVLIKAGADVQSKDGDDQSPLNAAAQRGNVEIVCCLVAAGADVESTDVKDRTPLNHAAAGGHRECLEELLKAGAKVETKNARKWTPLYSAVYTGDAEVVEILLRAGANANCRGPSRSALQEAVKRGHLGVVNILLAAGAKANEKTPDGPLVYEAARNHHLDIYRTLMLCSGPDVNAADKFGKKALQYLPLYGIVGYETLDKIGKMQKKLTLVTKEEMPNITHCPDMNFLHTIPGLGSIDFLNFLNPETSVYDDVETRITSATSDLLERLDLKRIKCGSVAEGTKVGLPDGIDYVFVLEKYAEKTIHVQDIGSGYKRCVKKVLMPPSIKENLITEGSHVFHGYYEGLLFEEIDKQAAQTLDLICAPHTLPAENNASTPLYFRWKDRSNESLAVNVYVDIVPAIQITGWPEDARESTWMMDKEELGQHGHQLVAKPPSRHSKLGKTYLPDVARKFWRTSFAELETLHISSLAPEVKNIFVTAKMIRNPDVCRIMIRDKMGMMHSVDKFISTYMLKTVFLHNVEVFFESGESFSKKVFKIYEELEKALSDTLLPSYWQPCINVLDQVRTDTAKAFEVAKIMKAFVGALYMRDGLQDPTAAAQPEAQYGYQVYQLD
ncbi:serine/threonine-protein phosphatase 6 regulatory ankyrin repeat subunit C-like [Lineus longissimus]|uniref:serine/threonine-protein phosphatase 6 regulatory ankyrin repeat subunit C-like n=1 Tax=Lineus longissimus TaxID=88925 RepID=UPI00315CCAE4